MKTRINELARELEVKPHRIIELLPDLGVVEKKTHSSSVEDDVVIKIREYFGLSPLSEDAVARRIYQASLAEKRRESEIRTPFSDQDRIRHDAPRHEAG